MFGYKPASPDYRLANLRICTPAGRTATRPVTNRPRAQLFRNHVLPTSPSRAPPPHAQNLRQIERLSKMQSRPPESLESTDTWRFDPTRPRLPKDISAPPVRYASRTRLAGIGPEPFPAIVRAACATHPWGSGMPASPERRRLTRVSISDRTIRFSLEELGPAPANAAAVSLS